MHYATGKDMQTEIKHSQYTISTVNDISFWLDFKPKNLQPASLLHVDVHAYQYQ